MNGEQHYNRDSIFYEYGDDPKKTFEYRKNLDEYKKQYALDHGYNFLAIPYWEFDKENTWKKTIDEKIKEIKGK